MNLLDYVISKGKINPDPTIGMFSCTSHWIATYSENIAPLKTFLLPNTTEKT